MNIIDFFNLLLGFCIGIYGTLVGAGGGFLLVPFFILIYKMPHEMAVGTSIAIVAANATSGALRYMQQKKVDYRIGFSFALATLPGAYFGALLTKEFSGAWFQRVFGLLLISISLYLFFRKEKNQEISHSKGWGMVDRSMTLHGKQYHYSYSEPLGVVISVIVGFISSWLGIGGGILHVPAMTEWLKIPVHIATASSHFVLAFTAILGAFVHAESGDLNLHLAIWIGAGAILGAQVGAHIAPRVKGASVLRYLSLALILVGIRLLF